jgi:hypothetical protein
MSKKGIFNADNLLPEEYEFMKNLDKRRIKHGY